MVKTLDDGPWEYLPVVNECIKILITIMIGAIAGHVGALDVQVFVPQAVKFVFQVRTLGRMNKRWLGTQSISLIHTFAYLPFIFADCSPRSHLSRDWNSNRFLR